jgi:DNA-binding CsgD family transcriptional regulator
MTSGDHREVEGQLPAHHDWATIFDDGTSLSQYYNNAGEEPHHRRSVANPVQRRLRGSDMPDRVSQTTLIERHFGTLVDAMGTDSFGPTVRDVARNFGMHDIFGFILMDDLLPNPIIATSDDRANFYSRKYHSLDPMLKLLRRLSPSAPISVCRIRVADIENAAYRRDCFESAFLDEKLCFVLPREGRWHVLNFYRAHGDTEPDMETCRLLAEIIMPLMRKHAALAMLAAHHSPVLRIERLLRDHFPNLTVREVAVCARTATGKTAREISDELGIAKSSVLTYRRRAYVRFNVSSASQLLDRFAA